jgi:hypothetical protein
MATNELVALVSSGFNARLHFGELARRGRKYRDQGSGIRDQGPEDALGFGLS